MVKKKHQRKISLWLSILMIFSVFTGFIPAVSAENIEVPTVESNGIPENYMRIHYQRTDGVYNNYAVWHWGGTENHPSNWPSDAVLFDGRSDYGAYVDIPLKADETSFGFLVMDREKGDAGKDGGDKNVNIISPNMNEIWIKQGSDEVFLWEPIDLPENTVRIHYERLDGNYEGWAVWNWGDVAEESGDKGSWPTGATDKSGVTSNGAYYDIELKEDAQSIGFLFVNKVTGAQTGDLRFEMLAQSKEIFVKEGVEGIFTNPFGAIPVALLSAEQLSDSKIELRFSNTEGLTEEELVEEILVADKDSNEVEISELTIKDKSKVELIGDFNLENASYSITYDEKTVVARQGWRMIDEMYAYDGELGATLHADGTATIKLWSPKAEEVSVILYDKDDQYEVVDEIEMTLGDRGVWSVTLDQGNTGLDSVRGYYYHYLIQHPGEDKPVLALDPYAKSMATWSSADVSSEYPFGKAAIVDPSSIGPELDFANIPGYEKREDAIIYEVHVRDFTSDYEIADELTAKWGTFAAFIERLDYIQDLGVTHVQLLPIMSYFFADEFDKDERLLEWSSTQNNYNWGYDPHSYFSITGMYSENPDDPEKRIEEFKMLIDEIHNREMGVILDVVYNHTARVGIFEDLVRSYYHFMDADGASRTSFGGGRLGTTHEMSRRILVDSIMYWVEEFKVDGFRFDMMGDHDAESIQIAFDKAQAVNPNIVMIGEGWRTFVGDEGDPVQAADQDWMQFTEAVGSFSDEFRNELKSGFGSEGQPRFITGGPRNVEQIFDNIKAQPHNFVADQPGDVVPYIEAHDNLTLYDVIAQSIRKDPELPENDLEIHKRIRIGNAMVLTAQGTAFIHAGQEFGRTKQFRAETTSAPYKSTHMVDQNGNPFVYPYFIHDSYDSTDIINRFDWNKATNVERYPINNLTREYTTGLIALRRSTDAFRLGSKELVDENVTFIDAPEVKDRDLVIAYRNEATNGDAYYVFINADMKERTFTIGEDLTGGIVLVDAKEAGVEEVSNPTGFNLTSEAITLDALTTVVVKVASEKDPEEPGTEKPGTEKPGTEKPGTEKPGTEKPGTEKPGTEKPGTEKPGTEKPGTEKPKTEKPVKTEKEQTVKGEFDKKTNVVTIDSKVVEKVATDGKIVIDLKETKRYTTADVHLSKEQVAQLREKNATVELVRDNVRVTFPMVNLPGNEPVEIRIEQYQDYEGAVSAVYKFTVKQGDKYITEFGVPVTLSFKVDMNKVENTDNLRVFYYNEETGKWENIGGTYKDGYVTIETDHFSIFTVFEVEDEEFAGESPIAHEGNLLPDTATALYNYLLIGTMLLLAGAGVFFFQRKKLAKAK